MRYYVIGPDGNRYGPADIATLNQWIAEGRLLANQMLEDEASGARIAASAVQGLNFAPPGPQQPGQPYQNHYARPGYAPADDGSKDVSQAWIWATVSLLLSWFCCTPLLAIPALMAVKRAESKGNPKAVGPKVLTIVALVIFLIRFVQFALALNHVMQSRGLR